MLAVTNQAPPREQGRKLRMSFLLRYLHCKDFPRTAKKLPGDCKQHVDACLNFCKFTRMKPIIWQKSMCH